MTEKKYNSTLYNKRWKEKNPERNNYLRRRSDARNFVKSWAKNEDMDELESLIKIRRQELADGTAKNADV